MIVLDTHAWLWWASDSDRLSPIARAEIDDADVIGVSAISALELARLGTMGRLVFDDVDRWVNEAFRFDQRILELPVTTKVALWAVELLRRGLLGDPNDQLILATAQLNSARLVTKDSRLREFAREATVW
ncbi:MAG: type II toxin-antitoxin system VapC family toxin [Solirubrobacterales bacterium]|nr:type II toxin-antitoxin system VapC family toxin [Solirubrobacterales bacterium]